ncbi:uncharacterized protein LOC110814437 isoform X2 [Carica papaya]|uniref:uncharacterized protein LOC110814437 isoform X2 n=1 Tax=Carica papaya TaxID=3649 RepID=UPI000B8D07C3|nr:uncharacterized protein LOC110814437 isoform X2 [Carica papaya]
MEELRKLEQVQKILSLMQSCSLLSSSTSSNNDQSRFIANLILLMVQPSGELDMVKKLSLVSEYLPKISVEFLEEASTWLGPEHGSQNKNTDLMGHSSSAPNHEDVAMVGLDAMQRANSTLEDFCRSYFMFHGMDINNPHSIFKYLPVLSFTESYIYQLDSLNEKMMSVRASHDVLEREHEMETNQSWIAKFMASFETSPFRPLEVLLKCNGLLTERIVQELKSGEEYWALERKLCSALVSKQEICFEDVMRAIRLKSFDYRVLNLLLFQLRGEEVNDLHMEFLSISEFLVEVSDDLFDYEDDVLENNFNILRMFVKIFGPSPAPAMLAKYITEAEDKYDSLMKTLEPQLSLKYQRRCEEATKEGGKMSGHPLGTWNIPPVIVDEEFYRSNLLSN